MPTLKPQSNGPLYSNTAIGTLAADGWVLHLVQRGGAYAAAAPAASPLLAVPNVTAQPSTASVPTTYYLMWHLKGCGLVSSIAGMLEYDLSISQQITDFLLWTPAPLSVAWAKSMLCFANVILFIFLWAPLCSGPS